MITHLFIDPLKLTRRHQAGRKTFRELIFPWAMASAPPAAMEASVRVSAAPSGAPHAAIIALFSIIIGLLGLTPHQS